MSKVTVYASTANTSHGFAGRTGVELRIEVEQSQEQMKQTFQSILTRITDTTLESWLKEGGVSHG